MLQVTNSFTIDDMRRFAGEAWGELGANVVEQWCRFNVVPLLFYLPLIIWMGLFDVARDEMRVPVKANTSRQTRR